MGFTNYHIRIYFLAYITTNHRKVSTVLLAINGMSLPKIGRIFIPYGIQTGGLVSFAQL
jgi:hypothetical protein